MFLLNIVVFLIRKSSKKVSAYGEKRFSQLSPAGKKYNYI